MSARRFAKNVPLAVQMAVRMAQELADPKSNEVEGGMPGLQAALGYGSARATRELVIIAESFNLLKRSGPIGHGPRRLFVVVARLNPAESCDNCASPVDHGRWCKKCQSALRVDRAWRLVAVEMLIAKKSLPAIAAAVSKDLFPKRHEGPTAGVVAFLLGEHPKLVPDEWRRAYAEVMGAEYEHLASILTSRARQRRHRRKAEAT